MDRLTRVFVAVMATLAASVGIANAGVTTVTLKGTVRLAPTAPVTLGSIATIEGEHAEQLESIVIGSESVLAGAWTEIDAKTVRRAIVDANAPEGSIVVIGQLASLTRVAQRATSKTIESNTPTEPETSVITVRDHIESWLRSRFRVAPNALRVEFNERDFDVITTPTDGRMVGVVEIGKSSRMALRVTVYEGDRIVLTESVRVGVELRGTAAIVDRPLRRGARIRETDVREETIWYDPTEPPAPLSSVIGQALLRSAERGQVLRDSHLEPAVMIERGQDVSVQTVRGSIVVSTTARARHNASMGELIELEAKDGSRRRYTARVAGPGRAVMTQTTSNRTSAQPINVDSQPNLRAESTTAQRDLP